MRTSTLTCVLILAFVGNLSTVGARALLGTVADNQFRRGPDPDAPKSDGDCMPSPDNDCSLIARVIDPFHPTPHDDPHLPPGSEHPDDDGSGNGSGDDGSGSGHGSDSTNHWDDGEYEFSDDDEADPFPTKFAESEADTDWTQALAYQKPSPKFVGFFERARVVAASLMRNNKALFWSGAGTKTKSNVGFFKASQDYALANDRDHSRTIFGALKNDRPSSLTQAENQERNGLISAAMARSASGDVQVMLPVAGMPKNTIWTDVEWPELTRKDGPVTTISWVNPDTSEVTLIWDRNGGYTGDFPINVPFSDGKFPLRAPPATK